MASFDQSRLDAAIRERVKFPGRTEAQIVNTAAYWVAVNAKNEMPFVAPGKIDTELSVAVNLKVSRNGGWRKGQKFQRENRTFGAVGNSAKVAANRSVPLLVLIAQARANPNSNYNKRTNNRYALARSPFKGVSRKAGQAAMTALTRRMFAARKSSTHFLQSGWIEAIRVLGPLAVNKLRSGGGPPPLDGAKFDYGFAKRGMAAPAVAGSWMVTATIENSTGMSGINGPNYNQALMMYGVGPLQRAIDREASLMWEYVEKAYAPADARFNEMCR